MDKIDRRESARATSESSFHYCRLGGGSAQQFLHGRLIDYSIAGIRFIADKPLEKNTSLLIKLDLSGIEDESVDWRNLWEAGEEDRLDVIGTVMWCLASDKNSGEYEVGTRFIEKAERTS